jgi:hypothetical protein
MNKILLLPALLVLSLCALLAPARAAEADLKADLAKIQGKWKSTVSHDDRSSEWTMIIKGSKATLIISSRDGEQVFKGEFDFRLEQHGKFRAFTYSNLKHLSGSKEGETELTEGKNRSSIYKFEDSSTFSTIGGFRDDYDEPQILVRWQKTKE